MDVLATPSSTGIQEGTDISTYTDKFAGRARLGNYVQLFRRDYMVSQLQQAVESVGPARIAEAEAKAIIASIKKGGKFEDIAKKQSKDSGSGAKGGELDWANAASYVKEFSAAMVALQKGKMTETPVKSQFGYHIIRLEDSRDAEIPKFEDVKPQITQQLTQQKLAKYQEELRAKAKIE